MAKHKKNKRTHKFGGALASSYEKYLGRELEKLQLQGAMVTVKVYRGRMPGIMCKLYEMSNKELKKEDLLLVALWSGRKIIAHSLIEAAFYYKTIKTPGSAIGGLENDYMVEAVEAAFLRPLRSAIDDRT